MENKPTHFIGIGGLGANIVDYFYNQGVNGRFTVISKLRNPILNSKINFIEYIYPFTSNKHSKELIPSLKEEYATMLLIKFNELLNSEEKIVFVSDLGFIEETFLLETLVFDLYEKNKSFMCIASIPFYFEGKIKKENAKKCLLKLKELPEFYYYDLANIIAEYGKGITVNLAFDLAMEKMYETYKKALILGEN